ncbi:MAG: type I-C CRISPR-associated endonuclease Cas1c [Paludibacteraceae bacterium]|nr:type I-C CRISPR-associated endonuclease Cas1c [Paludibacteraceae bacterium]
MKTIKNTLYVTLSGSYVHKDGETITIHKDHVQKAYFPIHQIGEIVCYGYSINVSPYLAEFCSEKGITITYVDGRGKFLARMQGPIKGNVLLRREQYRIADNAENSLELAKCCIAAKIQNQRNVLLRHLRNHSNCEGSASVKAAIKDMEQSIHQTKKADTAAFLRGIEGDAAEKYFSVFNYLILNKDPAFRFCTRNRRPPLDRINALLSYAYSLLALDVRSALECVGLDPYVGFLHTDRPGRASLALDMMEEFRAPIADRLVLSLINLKKVDAKDFNVLPSGEVEMNECTRQTFLSAWQKRKTEEIIHPILDETMQTGLLYIEQARLLAKCIRGDLDYYPSYIWR